ncbi:uncharacterized protein LOC128397835 [Panonychus citri]|uniref:uncharacterized protein LOC128397835 n=1 Tax=Panonychus citri TaxID=50023 RepID=UPI0023071DDC|nr:uncharacterized protein LOC128397835 [Panonychus citri]
MVWTYLDVHVYFTLPFILIEYLILRPFLNVHEFVKLSFISACALIYTIPWDNYIVYHDAWSYPIDRVLGVIGWVPYEEYAFFIIQTVLSSLWTILCMRWSVPCLHLNFNPISFNLIRYIPCAIFLVITIIGASIGIPGTKTFYLGSLLWWICPVLCFLWFGAGNYFVSQWKTVAISLIVPSIYLCWVDTFSLRQGIWHINTATSIEWFVVPELPLEEALFFTIVNFLIILANCAFDKAKCTIDLYPDLFPTSPSLTFSNFPQYFKQTFFAFAAYEPNLPKQRLEDLIVCFKVLNHSSKSFTAAASTFHSGIRIDLSILYGFARVTDDMIDNSQGIKTRREKLSIINKFLDQLFADRGNRKWTYDVPTKMDPRKKPKINWKDFTCCLSKDELAAFRALTHIVYYLPSEPFYELARGYSWDIEDKTVETESDLLEYSSYVASSIGILCTFVMCYKSGKFPNGVTDDHIAMVERAKEMGQVLQIVNIARDIVTDSVTLGRCYVPTNYMDCPEKELKLLKVDRNPWSLGQDKLKDYALKMLNLADDYATTALNGIPLLPNEVQAPVLVTTQIYRMIGVQIATQSGYLERVYVSKVKKLIIALTCMYAKFMHTKKTLLSLHQKIE